MTFLLKAFTSLLLLVVASGCGVRQFNGKVKPKAPTSRLFASFGPFYSAAQEGNNLTSNPAACGSATRPCLKMRASIGLPYQFDTNTNTQQGPLVAGTSYVAAPQPYSTQIAGPGKIKPITSTRSDQAQFENKDLKMMKRQTAGGNYTIH